MEKLDYIYSNLPIPGGGYVTGFMYHPRVKNILYCRTDIGGVYRYDYTKKCWISLIDHVTMQDLSETYPTAIALDANAPGRLYIACGVSDYRESRNGIFAVSEDFGETFSYYEIPCVVHGNFPGRGTGTRLVVDPNNSDIIYFASQRGGLLRSTDRGRNWEKLSIESAGCANEDNTCFIWVNPVAMVGDRSGILVLSTSGINNSTMESDTPMRGHSLYISNDAGASFKKLSMPTPRIIDGVRYNGLVGHRYDFDGKYFYVTLSSTGPTSHNFPDRVPAQSYSCDSGDACDGRIIRYAVNEDGLLSDYEDITPTGTIFNYSKDNSNGGGFGGICSSPVIPGLIVASTICEKRGDMVFMSQDYGDTWQLKLFNLNKIKFDTPYMKPEYNGGRSLIHWLSDIKINPFNPDDVIFNTGTGIFGTYNLTAPECVWRDRCQGVEETVHLGVYSPPSGDVLAIDAVGDLGGFAFTSLDSACENTFADEKNDRYITCINADFSDEHPDFVVATPRGNWTDTTKGGLIISKDQCSTWKHIDMPFGITPYIDDLLTKILRPNTNSGWVAVSPDCSTIIWCVCEYYRLPIDAVIYSHDEGRTFNKSVFYGEDGTKITSGYARVLADRVNSNIFYAFESTSRIFVSTDRGHTFRQIDSTALPQDIPLCHIDTMDRTSVCPVSHSEGCIYLSLVDKGVYFMEFNGRDFSFSIKKLSGDGDIYYKIGLGISHKNSSLPTIFAAATINGEYGFYRSTDNLKTLTRINNSEQMFGGINHISGDARIFGRFFIATGSRGLIYGEPITQEE